MSRFRKSEMEEVEGTKESEAEIRVRKIKEDLRKKHAERLQGLDTVGVGVSDEPELSRFNKYRRSGSERRGGFASSVANTTTRLGSSVSYGDQLETRRRRSEEDSEDLPPQCPLRTTSLAASAKSASAFANLTLNSDHENTQKFSSHYDDKAQIRSSSSRFSKPKPSGSGSDDGYEPEPPLPSPYRSRWKHPDTLESVRAVNVSELPSRLPVSTTARSSSILKSSSSTSRERSSFTYSPTSVRKLRPSKSKESSESDVGEDGDVDVNNVSTSRLPVRSSMVQTTLKKPSIPLILRQSTLDSDEDEVMTRKTRSRQREFDESCKPPTLKKKIPSILKKKDEQDTQHSGATVSFDLDELPTSTASSLIRTKSSDSNLSCDSETGYWSGDGVVMGILKNSRSREGSRDSDHKSILKPRRSSLGSSMVSTPSPDSDGLQGILKRKLSYDSSVLRQDSHNQYSLSTNSLPTSCGSLSPEPSSILKKKSSSEDLEDLEPPNPRPILKKSSTHLDYGSNSGSTTPQDYHHRKVHSFDDRDVRPILKKPSPCVRSSSVRLEDSSSNCESPWSSSSSSTPSRVRNSGGSILKGSASTSSDIDKCHSFESNRVFGSRSNSSLPDDSFLKDQNQTLVTGGRLSWGDLGGTRALHSPPGSCSSALLRDLPNFHQRRRDSEPNYYVKSEGEYQPETTVLPSGDQQPIATVIPIITSIVLQSPSPVQDLDSGQGSPKMDPQTRSESQEDIIMGLSVAEKRSLFMQMERESLRGTATNSQGNRKKRFSTQPVTTIEVEEAAKSIGIGSRVESEVGDGDESGSDISFSKNMTRSKEKVHNYDHLSSTKSQGETFQSSMTKRVNTNANASIADYLEAAAQAVNSENRGAYGRSSLGNVHVKATTPSSSSTKVFRAESFKLKGEEKKETVDSLPTAQSGKLYGAGVTLKPVAPPRRMTIAHSFVSTTENLETSHVQTIFEETKETNFTSRTRACDEFDPSKLSLIDRVRMFNGLASTSAQPLNKLPVKRPVTSKRFTTQPVTTLEHLQCQEYGPKCNNKSSSSTGSVISIDGHGGSGIGSGTVRDEEGQVCEVECGQGLRAGDASISVKAIGNVLITSSETKTKKEDAKQSLTDTRAAQEETLLDCSGTLISVAGLRKSLTTTSATTTPTAIASAFPEFESEMPEKLSPELSGLGMRGRRGTVEESSSPSSDEGSSDNSASGSGSDGKGSFVKKRLSKSSSCTFAGMSGTEEVGVLQTTIKNTSIAEKIAALKTNGEINWKKRLTDKIPMTDQNDNLDLRKNNKDSNLLANRLSLLEKSQDGWKKRISENDATLFTVQGKLEKAGKVVERKELPNPILTSEKKLKGLKAPLRFRGKNAEVQDVPPPVLSDGKDSVIREGMILNDENKKNQMKVEGKVTATSRISRSSSSSCDSEEEKVMRTIAQNDNETFTQFFKSSTESESLSSSVTIDESSFDSISTAGQLLGLRRNVKVNRKHTNVKNPIKMLASRLTAQSYLEVSPEIREKELVKRTQIEQLSKTSHLSIEALAGLASKEDFTAVKLKKTKNEPNKEFPHPMLICIKGKRFVQIRLIPPQVKSLSSGDCYILVTPNKVYQYIGEFSNRMEKSKLADVVAHIVQKKDLGVSGSPQVITIEEPIPYEGRDFQSFNQLLGGGKKSEVDHLGDEHDEAYEMGVIRTNRVYEVDVTSKELIPLLNEGGWSSQPKYSMLKEDRVLIFDFGTEMYVWSGSRADSSIKKIGFRLAKEMFDDHFTPEFEAFGNFDEKRPSWCWIKKINQHMEPILFIEKFFDWPDESGKVIKIQQKRTSDVTDAGFNYQPCNVDEMLAEWDNAESPTLELEGVDVCRASEDNKEHRYTVTTTEVKSWHISEFSKSDVDPKSIGVFYSGETYVIRWQYRVTQISRDLKGNISRHSGALGRERTAYFFWHGKDSRLTEQGTSALMTVELDQEKGPQVRVEQGREPPAFLALFKGRMLINSGVSGVSKDARLYVAIGSVEDEGHVVEVPVEPSSFRSRGSFILVDFVKKSVFVWHGFLSTPICRKIAQTAAKQVADSRKEFKGTVTELNEGDESKSFLESIRVSSLLKWRESYVSLAGRSDYKDVQVFQFSSLTGNFTAIPILCPTRKVGAPNAFPILQEELYDAQQPSLFLISTGVETWLWQGWRPRGNEENENTVTGSSEFRWAAERKAALETTLSLSNKQNMSGFLINAGLEPSLFKTIFPYWKTQTEAMETNLADGKTLGAAEPVSIALEKFQKKTYTLEELQERPEGVDMSKLESYISDVDFENLLKMSRDAFSKLQGWRQTELKKIAGLF